MKTVYILMHIISEDLTQMVGLIKKKGFSYLIDKITVPGGKAEPGETIFEAASRETKEECGLEIPTTDWKLFDTIEKEEYTYHKVYAFSNEVSLAKQMEVEPVFVMDVQKHREASKTNPSLYPPDFAENMERLFLAIEESKKPSVLSLYPEYFYTVKYNMDNMKDSQPHVFEINMCASTGLKLSDYDESLSQENVASNIRLYISFEDHQVRPIKPSWLFNTNIHAGSFDDFIKTKINSSHFKSGLIFSEKVTSSSNDLESIFKHIAEQVKNNIHCTDNLKSYVQEKYQRDKTQILQRMETIEDSLKIKMIDLEEKGQTKLDMNKVLEQIKTYLPSSLTSPLNISNIKLNKHLNHALNEKNQLNIKRKI